MSKIDIKDLTIREVESLSKYLPQSKQEEAHPYEDLIGKAIFVRTVTFYYVARLKKVYSKELVIEHVCWIPDTGRFNECMKEGRFNEIEPFNLKKDVFIGRGAIIDLSEWNFDLPTQKK